MQLVLDARMAGHSGIGRYIRYLIPLLTSLKNIRLTLLGGKKELGELFPGVPVIEMRSPVYSPLEQLEFLRKIPPCDVFWSPHYNAPVFRTRARRTVATIHDMFPFSGYAAKAGMGFFKRIYARFLLRNAVVRSDRLIAVSEATRAEIHAHVRWKGDRKKKISVIRHYIDPVFKKTGGGPAVSLGRYLLYVGNVKPHKNIVGILGALRLTIRNNAGIKLVIAGKKDGFITGMKDWDRQLDLLGIREKVTFTGALPDRELVSLYSHALALVFPSFYEGFGYPPLEAMACGCPVVAADIPPLRETCGNAAVYANPFSVTGIANGIKKALDGKNRKKLVILGKKNVLRFGKKEVTEKYGKFLDSLLKTENEDV